MDYFIIFADKMKSHNIEFLIITIIIIIINIIKVSGIKFIIITIIIMLIVVIINIIKSHSITINLSDIKFLSLLSPLLLLLSSLLLWLASTSWNIFLQMWQDFWLYDSISSIKNLSIAAFPLSHSWLSLLHVFLHLHRTFSCSQYLWKSRVSICCYRMNSVWIIKKPRCMFTIFLWKKVLHMLIFSSSDSVYA